jgi:glycerol uptake facilitator-like aquaporin
MSRSRTPSTLPFPTISKTIMDLKSTEDPAPIRRWRTSSTPISPSNINSQPFVGRIGGNQLHAVSQSDPDYEALQESNPDAVQSPKWRGILSLKPFRDVHLWRNAAIEGMGLCLWVFIAGLVAHGTANLSAATSLGPILPVGIAAVVQFLFVTLFIFSLGPVTGAHLTPLITFATFLAKLTSLPRMVLYIIFQCIGAIIGAYILRAALGGDPITVIYSPGCYIDSTLVPSTQAFALETMGSIFVLFLAFGLGLDPRNQGSFSPSLGPFLVGLSSAIALFAGGISVKGYLGLSCNPARCLGLMSAGGRFTFHWVHWIGDFTACIIHGLIYYAVPPFCNQRIQD